MTDKQKAFIHEYPVDFIGTQAAIRAGYSKKTANRIADQLLHREDIRNEINKIIRSNLSKLDEAGLRLLRTVEHAAHFDLRRIIDWDDDGITIHDSENLDTLDAMMISEVQVTPGKYGRTKSIKCVSKEKAWDIMAKFSKLIDVDTSTDTQEEKMSREDRQERIAALIAKRGN
ncbi:MAG: terminase small subunit [Spirochaetales bacterium]|jgi:phage terminase small subunit|nr:terminase small subunit [Spirochaetales bacterium]